MKRQKDLGVRKEQIAMFNPEQVNKMVAEAGCDGRTCALSIEDLEPTVRNDLQLMGNKTLDDVNNSTEHILPNYELLHSTNAERYVEICTTM